MTEQLRTLLIVDDEEVMRRLLLETLKPVLHETPCAVVTASSVEEALTAIEEFLSKGLANVVLSLDWLLVEKDGTRNSALPIVEAVEAAKVDHPEIASDWRVVFRSTYGIGTIKEALNASHTQMDPHTKLSYIVYDGSNGKSRAYIAGKTGVKGSDVRQIYSTLLA